MVLMVCMLYSLLIVYAYMPEETISLRVLQTDSDQYFQHDGNRVRYQLLSELSVKKPKLILIHGFGNSRGTWESLAPKLSKAFNVYEIDMLGFGLSEKPVHNQYTNAKQASVNQAFAAGMGVDSIIVGGHSLGGAIAMHAAMIDQKTQGLILFNPGTVSYTHLTLPTKRIV